MGNLYGIQGDKAMSDTPRTDVSRLQYTELQEFVEFVPADFARILERQLNAANERLRRLEALGKLDDWSNRLFNRY